MIVSDPHRICKLKQLVYRLSRTRATPFNDKRFHCRFIWQPGPMIAYFHRQSGGEGGGAGLKVGENALPFCEKNRAK